MFQIVSKYCSIKRNASLLYAWGPRGVCSIYLCSERVWAHSRINAANRVSRRVQAGAKEGAFSKHPDAPPEFVTLADQIFSQGSFMDCELPSPPFMGKIHERLLDFVRSLRHPSQCSLKTTKEIYIICLPCSISQMILMSITLLDSLSPASKGHPSRSTNTMSWEIYIKCTEPSNQNIFGDLEDVLYLLFASGKELWADELMQRTAPCCISQRVPIHSQDSPSLFDLIFTQAWGHLWIASFQHNLHRSSEAPGPWDTLSLLGQTS